VITKKIHENAYLVDRYGEPPGSDTKMVNLRQMLPFVSKQELKTIEENIGLRSIENHKTFLERIQNRSAKELLRKRREKELQIDKQLDQFFDERLEEQRLLQNKQAQMEAQLRVEDEARKYFMEHGEWTCKLKEPKNADEEEKAQTKALEKARKVVEQLRARQIAEKKRELEEKLKKKKDEPIVIQIDNVIRKTESDVRPYVIAQWLEVAEILEPENMNKLIIESMLENPESPRKEMQKRLLINKLIPEWRYYELFYFWNFEKEFEGKIGAQPSES